MKYSSIRRSYRASIDRAFRTLAYVARVRTPIGAKLRPERASSINRNRPQGGSVTMSLCHGPWSVGAAEQASPLPRVARYSLLEKGVVNSIRTALLIGVLLVHQVSPCFAETPPQPNEWTAESRVALSQGLAWLAAHQGDQGNWNCRDLGLVSLGALAYLSAGETPGHGRYGDQLQRSLKFITTSAQKSGLLNIADAQRDMYNHGLTSFVLAQAYGTGAVDAELGTALRNAIRLILETQAKDGGWDYEAKPKTRGHDLSLVVMQAKALRGGRDCGLYIPTSAIEAAIKSVREHYQPASGARFQSEIEQRAGEGQFSYSKGPGGETLAMAAAGVVCLQEFGQYDDWRIEKNLAVICREIDNLPAPEAGDGSLPFDAYTTYYIAHALYHAGGSTWGNYYPKLRDYIVKSRMVDGSGTAHWLDQGPDSPGRVSGESSPLFATSVACFVLAMPNRYLPILQEGELTSFQAEAGSEP